MFVNINDANWVSMGGMCSFTPHKTVQMLGEDINIDIFDDRVHVKVVFSFENIGPATTVKMGFPFTTVNWNENFVKYFKSWVDGVPVPVERLNNVPILGLQKEELEWTRNAVFVKTVGFHPSQQRTIVVEYETSHGLAGGGYVFDSYILESGATWAGNIQNITATVDWSKTRTIGRPDLGFAAPKGQSIQPHEWVYFSPKRATVSISDVEPHFNLFFGTITGFWNVTINGVQVHSEYGYVGPEGPTLSGDPKDPLIRIEGVPQLFGRWTGFIDDGVDATQPKDGIKVTKNAIVLINGKKLVLKRGVVDDSGSWSTLSNAYLRDVVEAMGGTYAWNHAEERIDIKVPFKWP